MTKRKLTRGQHVKIGKDLAKIRDRLGSVSVELDAAYPHSVANPALRAQAAVDRLRAKLDGLVFDEHPDRSTKDNASIYYPGRDRDSSL